MRRFFRPLAITVFSLLALIVILTAFVAPKPTTVSFDRFVANINEQKVAKVEVQSANTVDVTLNDGSHETVIKESTESLPIVLKAYGLTDEQIRALPLEIKTESTLSAILGLVLPYIIMLVLFGGLAFFMARQIQGANSRAMTFGQSGAREIAPEHISSLGFSNVAGAKEAKQELDEVVEFLKSPEKFQAVGARIPKGVLLIGAPGTGKTLLARAVAGEANVPFFHISGSEFVEMFVGVGASRVRDLFRRAKKAAPCIVFIDEIDAVGRQRGSGMGGGHDEREQTLNQILVEMDGFEPNDNVIVMAATNRPDVLDQALLRPGRFDRRVTIDLPDIKDRAAILLVHAQGKPVAADASLQTVAERTPGFSGADLANVLNEAAILTARRNKESISNSELFESVEKVMLGPERRSHVLSPEEKRITAYHEAGHALVANTLPHADPVHKVSIISRGQAAGYTLKLPGEDKHFHSRAEFIDDLAVMLGGYTVEKEILGELTTGASSDLRSATRLARKLVTDYGMSALGPRTFGEREDMVFMGGGAGASRDYSEAISAAIDKEVAGFLRRAQVTAKRVIKERRADLERIVEKLLEKETLEREEFEAILATT